MAELPAMKISQVVREGFKRLKEYRAARAMYIRDYVGQYMRERHGYTGEQPINLVFLALRALIPNLAAREGVNKITTEILANRDYAELMGLALNRSQKQRKLKKIIRSAIVDMHFGFATLKTSIKASGELLPVDNDVNVDPGQIYTDNVSLDDLSIDPLCRRFECASFIGHRVRVPRQELLDGEGWNKDLVLQLPSVSTFPYGDKRAEELSQQQQRSKMGDLQDYVYVIEVYVPEADATCYVPDPFQTVFSDYLKVTDYYGPDEGPYTFGSLTPPIPDNPFPIAPVGVWRDLSDMANRVFKKYMGQSERQKDLLVYNPSYADEAQAVAELPDGESLACADPTQVKVISFGGQNPSNEHMVGQLQVWFNYMAGNPDQLAGLQSGAKTDTATEVQILQSNASVSLQDMRDSVYEMHADVSRKEAWFLHTDPLMFDPRSGKSGIPLTRRSTGGEEVQIWLTPEQRRGDWAEFTFEIVKRSMQVLEPILRAKRIMEFCTNVVPAVITAGQAAMQMGIPYNVPRQLMQVAEEMGISECVIDVFNDPTFQQRMAWFAQVGPQDPGKGTLSPKAVGQNQGFPMKRNILTPNQEMNQQSQEVAATSQSAMRTV